jgi:hypothetical protein
VDLLVSPTFLLAVGTSTDPSLCNVKRSKDRKDPETETLRYSLEVTGEH